MEDFDIYVTWLDSTYFRGSFSITANSYAEALKEAQRLLDDGEYPDACPGEYEYIEEPYLSILGCERCFIFVNNEIKAENLFEFLNLEEKLDSLKEDADGFDWEDFIEKLKENAVKEAESKGGKLFFKKSEARMFLIENIGSATTAIDTIKECPFLAALKKMEGL